MSATVQNAAGPPGAPLPADFEPDNKWKECLKQQIQDNIRPMLEEARKSMQEDLEKASPGEVERIRADGEVAIQNIYRMAQESYTFELQRERQNIQLNSGVWTEDVMKEQKVMWDNIERGKRHKATGQDSEHASSPPRPPPPPAPLQSPQPPPPPPPPPVTKPHSPDAASSRKSGRLTRAPSLSLDNERNRGASFSQPHSRDFDDVLPTVDEVHPLRSAKIRAGSITSASSYKAPIFEAERSSIDRPRHSPAYDDESILRSSRFPTDPPDIARRDSVRRKPSIGGRPNIPEIWKPSITPEEDAQMSRTFTLARRGSTASTTSSLRAPSVLNAQLTDEPQAMSSNVDREKAGIHMAEQEWGNLDRARDKEKQSRTHSESRPVLGAPQRLEERSGMHQPSSNIPNLSPASSTYSRPSDSSSRVQVPAPSASRPIVAKKSVSSFDDMGYGLSGSHGAKNWLRSPYGSRNDSSSRSPQTPDENPRNWQPSSLRTQFSSQDNMRNAYFQQEQLPTGDRPVHTHYEEDFEGQSDDEDVAWHHRGYHKYNLGKIKEIDDLRVREEAAQKWEEDLRRREERLEREKETGRIEEAKRKEDESRQEDEVRQKEEKDARLAERKAEEVETKRQRSLWIEEAKRKEKMKELEFRRREEEARKKEKEAESREEEAKRIAEEAMKKEDEAQRRERQASLKEAEVKRVEEKTQMKQAETLRKEAELRERESEVRRKEAEVRHREAEVQRREKEVLCKEAELARSKEEEKQRIEQEEKEKAQQEQFRKREEEIRRRTEEKKKQDGWTTWSDYYHPTPPPSQTSSASGPLPMPSRNDQSAPAASPPSGSSATPSRGSAGSGWASASARPSATPSSQTSSASKPTMGTTSSTKPSWNPLVSDAEFHQRQAEQARQREEQFKREQERIAKQEYERRNRVGREMTREEALKIFESHRRQWEKIQSRESLIWEDFPWPMFKTPSNPEDLTTAAIHSYVLSPFQPQDRSQKDRIKELIRRWHPDRFGRILSKVKASDRERVDEGGGSVVRVLNDLLHSSE